MHKPSSKRLVAPGYLDDPSFAEEHRGPPIRDAHGKPTTIRDPSRAQIRRMAAAIRKTYPRPAVGDPAPWTPPIVEALKDFNAEAVHKEI